MPRIEFMNRILILSGEMSAGGYACLRGERAAHICRVLRAQRGKPLRIGLLNGPRGIGRVESASAEEAVIDCTFEAGPPPRPPVDLLLALPRPKVLKRLWAQLAALGVGRIILTNADKVERYYFDSHVLNPEFYTARLIEGLQQAGDTLLPTVQVVKQLKPFLETEGFPEIGKRLLADPAGTRLLFSCLGPVREEGIETRVLLGVGPEGGWTPYELELFGAHGFELCGMGPRILRTDTACATLLGMISEFFRSMHIPE
jgi:16S rRNA (uracil1498-N3)-methyltransferase